MRGYTLPPHQTHQASRYTAKPPKLLHVSLNLPPSSHPNQKSWIRPYGRTHHLKLLDFDAPVELLQVQVIHKLRKSSPLLLAVHNLL